MCLNMMPENEYFTTCSNEVLFPSLVSLLEINNQYRHVKSEFCPSRDPTVFG